MLFLSGGRQKIGRGPGWHRVTAAIVLALLLGVGGVPSRAALALKPFAEGFVSPLALWPLPDGSGRLLVCDQLGTVQVLDKEGKVADKLFLDVRDRLIKLNEGFDERGLLSIALHPRFQENRRLFAFYSAPLRKDAPEGWDHTSHISEFQVREENRLEVDPASEKVVLAIDAPYFNHNGGRLAFGPDGFLYISVGDGGNGNDTGRGHSPQGNGQDTTKLLGKILRLDVDHGRPYGIPSDNPFVSGQGRPEIFAYGLRNSWGISFDRGGTHELFVADVGQDRFEEINIIVKGGNYGWNMREGFGCFDPLKPTKPPEDCPKIGAGGEPLLDPIVAYKNFKGFMKDPEAKGTSVTGGYVYRGSAIPPLQGRYVFADWSRLWVKADGVLFVATRPAAKETKSWSLETLDLPTHPGGRVGKYVVAMGQDAEGELYFLTNDSNRVAGKTGKIFKLVPQ